MAWHTNRSITSTPFPEASRSRRIEMYHVSMEYLSIPLRLNMSFDCYFSIAFHTHELSKVRADARIEYLIVSRLYGILWEVEIFLLCKQC